MKSRLILRWCLLATVCILASAALAGPNDPIAGEDYSTLIQAQAIELQNALSDVFPEAEGYVVSGPISILRTGNPETDRLFSAVRILCHNLESQQRAVTTLQDLSNVKVTDMTSCVDESCDDVLPGFRGVAAGVTFANNQYTVRLATPQQTRFLIWSSLRAYSLDSTVTEYARAVSDYLHAIDRGDTNTAPPAAVAFGAPESADIYATPPDYVISGYDNYMNFLLSHRPIYADFAQGLLAFIPSDSLCAAFVQDAPHEGYPNKEWPMIQKEYRKFFDRGGDVRTINTLTRAGFDTLAAGEYFFAVGANGRIRLGRELLRAEVKRLEAETGRKLARANHAFLFPGEPILTAGALFVERDNDKNRIVEITAQSGHYFYSNVSSTIKEDIALKSDHYLLTLGHALKALDSLGIPCDTVLIRKF